MILASVLLGLSILQLREDVYPPVFWTIMFMLWHVLMNSDNIASAPYSSTQMNENFLYWFLNVVKINLRMSRGGRLLLDVNPNRYEVAEHKATKVEVNSWMLSTLKKEKSIWSMKTGEKIETPVVGPLRILADFIKRKIVRVIPSQGGFLGDLPWRLFLTFFLVW